MTNKELDIIEQHTIKVDSIEKINNKTIVGLNLKSKKL